MKTPGQNLIELIAARFRPSVKRAYTVLGEGGGEFDSEGRRISYGRTSATQVPVAGYRPQPSFRSSGNPRAAFTVLGAGGGEFDGEGRSLTTPGHVYGQNPRGVSMTDLQDAQYRQSSRNRMNAQIAAWERRQSDGRARLSEQWVARQGYGNADPFGIRKQRQTASGRQSAWLQQNAALLERYPQLQRHAAYFSQNPQAWAKWQADAGLTDSAKPDQPIPQTQAIQQPQTPPESTQSATAVSQNPQISATRKGNYLFVRAPAGTELPDTLQHGSASAQAVGIVSTGSPSATPATQASGTSGRITPPQAEPRQTPTRVGMSYDDYQERLRKMRTPPRGYKPPSAAAPVPTADSRQGGVSANPPTEKPTTPGKPLYTPPESEPRQQTQSRTPGVVTWSPGQPLPGMSAEQTSAYVATLPKPPKAPEPKVVSGLPKTVTPAPGVKGGAAVVTARVAPNRYSKSVDASQARRQAAGQVKTSQAYPLFTPELLRLGQSTASVIGDRAKRISPPAVLPPSPSRETASWGGKYGNRLARLLTAIGRAPNAGSLGAAIPSASSRTGSSFDPAIANDMLNSADIFRRSFRNGAENTVGTVFKWLDPRSWGNSSQAKAFRAERDAGMRAVNEANADSIDSIARQYQTGDPKTNPLLRFNTAAQKALGGFSGGTAALAGVGAAARGLSSGIDASSAAAAGGVGSAVTRGATWLGRTTPVRRMAEAVAPLQPAVARASGTVQRAGRTVLNYGRRLLRRPPVSVTSAAAKTPVPGAHRLGNSAASMVRDTGSVLSTPLKPLAWAGEAVTQPGTAVRALGTAIRHPMRNLGAPGYFGTQGVNAAQDLTEGRYGDAAGRLGDVARFSTLNHILGPTGALLAELGYGLLPNGGRQ